MSNLSFYLSVRIPYLCGLVMTSKVDPRHKIVFANIGSLNKFYNLVDADFSDDLSFLRVKKIYDDDLLSLLKAHIRLRFNERFTDSTFRKYFFD